MAFGVVGVYGNAGTRSSEELLKHCDTVISVCLVDHTELLTNKEGLQVRRLIQIEEGLLKGDSLRFSPVCTFSFGRLHESLEDVLDKLEKELQESPDVRALIKQDGLGENRPEPWKSLAFEKDLKEIRKPAGTPSTYLSRGHESRPSVAIPPALLYTELNRMVSGRFETEHVDELKSRISEHQNDLCSTSFCHPAVFFQVVSESLEDDAVLCADIGDSALWMASSLIAKRGQRTLTSEHMGIMGYALNSCPATTTSTGKHQTLVVAGDGGFQMSLNELATLHDHKCSNVLVVIVENGRLGRVQNETWGAELKADGCDLGSPDFVKLFDAYGYPDGMVLETSDRDTIRDTINKGWENAAKNGMCVIVIKQDPRVHPVMHKINHDDLEAAREEYLSSAFNVD